MLINYATHQRETLSERPVWPPLTFNFCDKSICYQGVETWNNIPNHVKSSKNLNSFKASYKQLIISDYSKIILWSMYYGV